MFSPSGKLQGLVTGDQATQATQRRENLVSLQF